MSLTLAILAAAALAAVAFAAGWWIGSRRGYQRGRFDTARRTMRTLADLDTIRQAGADAFVSSHRRLLALHANNGTPLGGA